MFVGVNLQAKMGEHALARWGWIGEEALYHGSYWGLLTNAFVHQDPLHLIFNLYWLWILGGAFERTFGPARMLLFVVVTAVISSGLGNFEGTGIGLSGVGYALFGFGWVGRRRYPEFARTVTDRTVQMFVLWGLFCVFATYTHFMNMNIGNLAHLSGLLVGATLAGLILQPHFRIWLAAALVAMACGSVGSLFWNPRSLEWVANQAEKAERRGDLVSAERLYMSTLNFRSINPSWTWQQLAIMYGSHHMKQYKAAFDELKGIDEEAAADMAQDYGDPDKPEAVKPGKA